MSSNTYGRQVVLPLTNKSGGSVAAGDVVIVDTGNNDAFTTTTSAGFTGGIGIATGTIANNAVGVILVSGYASLVNVNASVTRGNFGKTFTVAKQASDAGAARVAGTFCQFLTGGTTPDAVVYPPDLAAAALTNPMTTVGDIIQGTTAGAPARLAASTAGFVLTSAGAATPLVWAAAGGLAVGTSFPGSPATNDLYYRTDRALLYYYDGTRWVTVAEYAATLGTLDTLFPVTSTANNSYGSTDQGANGAWVTRASLVTISIANDGSNFHTVQLRSRVAAGTTTTLGSSFTTAADTAGQNVKHTVTVGAVLGASDNQFLVSYTRTGGAASIYGTATVFYRLIG